MGYQLNAAQARKLEAFISAGEFESVEEAIDTAIAGLEIDTSDLDWTKPLIEEAEASLARGEGVSLDDVKARLATKFARHEK